MPTLRRGAHFESGSSSRVAQLSQIYFNTENKVPNTVLIKALLKNNPKSLHLNWLWIVNCTLGPNVTAVIHFELTVEMPWCGDHANDTAQSINRTFCPSFERKMYTLRKLIWYLTITCFNRIDGELYIGSKCSLEMHESRNKQRIEIGHFVIRNEKIPTLLKLIWILYAHLLL